MTLNLDSANFRLFQPDESNSNRWQDVLEVTNRRFMAEIYPDDDHLSPDERVMEQDRNICAHGDDMPEITGWRFGREKQVDAKTTSTEGDNVSRAIVVRGHEAWP